MPSLVLRATLLLLVAAAAGAQTPSRIVWGVDGATGNTAANLYRLSEVDGSATTVGAVGVGVTGLAVDPTDGQLYGATSNSGGDPRGLVVLDRATGAATPVAEFSPSSNIADLTFDAAGQLYGWAESFDGSIDDLAAIDKATAAVAIVADSMIGINTFGSGLAFCGPTLYLAPWGPMAALYTVDPLTGLAAEGVTLAGLGLPGEAVSALACRLDGSLVGANLGIQVGDAAGVGHLFEVAAPAASGTVVDLGASVDLLDALAIDEVAIADAGGTPGVPDPGETVSFSVTASATSPITFTWDFGDGGIGSGPSPSHAYASPGVRMVTVTASAAGPVEAARTFAVDVGGTGGTTTTTTAATTTTTTTTTLPPLPLTVDKLRITLKFAKSGRDKILVKGNLALPPGFVAQGTTMTADVGGVAGGATLNKKGKAPGFKIKKTGKFQFVLKRGTFAGDLADEGLTDETVSDRLVQIPIEVGLGDARYQTTRSATYGAKAGKVGKAK